MDSPALVIVSFLAGAFVSFSILGSMGTWSIAQQQNRALSCMAAGNTVEQCQDILGISNQK